MSYKIIVDSCTDLTEEMRKDGHFHLVPLELQVGESRIVDDETFDQANFLKMVRESPVSPKSSCPSPEAYMKLYGGDEDIYVVTLSANLSGSFNSAEVGKNLYLEENKAKNIEIFNSCSASVGQALIAHKIRELASAGKPFHEVVEAVHKFRDGLSTKFVLENLDTLRKSGRLTGLKAVITSVLNIKPVMMATPEGTITKLDQARGIQKALGVMVEAVEKDVKNPQDRILGIAHCNNYGRAQYVREELLRRVSFKDCIIVDTAGVSTMYAGDGGVIVCY